MRATVFAAFGPRLTTYEAELRAERWRKAKSRIVFGLSLLLNVTLAVKLISARHAAIQKRSACEAQP